MCMITRTRTNTTTHGAATLLMAAYLARTYIIRHTHVALVITVNDISPRRRHVGAKGAFFLLSARCLALPQHKSSHNTQHNTNPRCCLALVLSLFETITMSNASRIEYSEKYADDVNEYRYVKREQAHAVSAKREAVVFPYCHPFCTCCFCCFAY